MIRSLRTTLLALACSASFAAYAQTSTVRSLQIPAGDLVTALDSLARQSGAQFIYQADQLRGLRTRGVSGNLSTDDALQRLLAGSGFTVHHDASGAMVIVKGTGPRTPTGASRPKRATTHATAEAKPQSVTKLEPVIVTGSRIPRSQVEGPAPVITITAQDIARNGFATVSDVMTSLTQNLGALDNNQTTDGFSPGAQAVDLRGLGPNHTLVLVNGRRIADYPQAYGGNSNFTDISNLPTSLIDRVEILSGSASAIYGSDAMSGVINFILKKKADGTTFDYRAGDTQHGGGSSQRLQISSGYSNDKFDSVFALELYEAKPIWDFQRNFTDSRLDSPADPSDVVAGQTFVRQDVNGNYLDPGKATCDGLSHLDQGSVFYASRPGYAPDNNGGPGYYCGSYKDVGYGTLENGRKSANFFGSGTYHITDHMDLFLDVLASTSHQDSYNTPLKWENCEPLNGDCTPTPFYNQATGQVEQWERNYFTVEENGGLGPGEIRNINNTLSLTTGIKGSFGSDDQWDYEGSFGHSQNELKSKEPALVASKAQALYLGPSLGIDPDSGYQIYNAPPGRLYAPLTVQQFRSITQDSIDNDKSRAENWSLTVSNTELFHLPAGPVGFAGVAEYGNQYFGLKADPLSLDGSYYGLHNTTAVGSRSHSGAGVEFSVPIFSQLLVTAAGRYDKYDYSDNSSGKGTYAVGFEYRPFKTLLLRGSLGTGFRAPDLAYLYAGDSGSSSSGTDYYQCRRDEPESGPDYEDNCTNGDVDYNGRSHGSTALKDETSKSLTYGFVYSPTPDLDFTTDYYNIKVNNEVEYQSSDEILREEADCRLGVDVNGNPVDGNSSFCQQIESQVVRNSPSAPSNPNGITSVLVLPINAAVDQTSGVDFDTHYHLATDSFGKFDFHVGATYVIMHKTRLSPDVPVDNEMTDIYYYLIPRTKANASVTWTFHDFTTTLYGSRLSGIPNYDGTMRLAPTFDYNATIGYHIAPNIDLSLVVDNLFDSKPRHDSTWTSYPYYYIPWNNPTGRSFFLEASIKLGGSHP
ncbi:TonB-dependent receptor [Rhodanobacter sp. L36]|uniref:TonB-dependent receptor n=1 Tax=Rhodanobacter sp. L36 TaxID=1747221 RepID=UPI00131AAB9B|nr:TonB-dependent receptor [Rhodanobacter sp. L36]